MDSFDYMNRIFLYVCTYVCAVGNLFEVRFKIFLSLRVRL